MCTLGVPEEMVTEIVTTVGWEGAVKRAFNPGGAKEILPASASQLTTEFGDMMPSSENGICSLTWILQSFGRMATVFVGVATFPHAARKNRVAEKSKATLRNIEMPLYGFAT